MLHGISRNLIGTRTQTKNTDQRTTDSCSQTDKTHPWSFRSSGLVSCVPKLDETLSLLKRRKDPLNVIDILRLVTSTTLESVSNVPVKEDSIIGAREPTSPIFNSEVVTRDMDEDNLHHLWRRLCQGTRRYAKRRRRWHQKRCYWWENTLFPSDSQSSQQKDHWKQEQHVNIRMPPTATTIEIKERSDVHREFEFHMHEEEYSVWPYGCFIFRSKFYVAFGKENFSWRRSTWKFIWPKGQGEFSMTTI